MKNEVDGVFAEGIWASCIHNISNQTEAGEGEGNHTLELVVQVQRHSPRNHRRVTCYN